MDTMYPSVRYYRIWHPTEGGKGGGRDGEGRGESFTESNRFDSVRGPIPRTKDDRGWSRASRFCRLWKSRRLRVTLWNYPVLRLANGEEGRKKKKRWRLNNKTRLFRLVACTLCPFSVFSFRDGKKKKRLRLSVFRNPFPHVKRIRRQEWRRSLEERDSPSEEDTVSFNFFFFPPGSTRFQKSR